MALVLLVFAGGLAYAAWRARGGMRAALLAFCLLNIFATAAMIQDRYPYAWKLAPHKTAPGIDDPTPPGPVGK